MRTTQARTLAVVTILVAFGTLTFALVLGGNILMIVLGLVLAATSMRLFRHSCPEREDE